MSVDNNDPECVVIGPIVASSSSLSTKVLDMATAGVKAPEVPKDKGKVSFIIIIFCFDISTLMVPQHPETKLLEYNQVPGLALSSKEAVRARQLINPDKRAQTEPGKHLSYSVHT